MKYWGLISAFGLLFVAGCSGSSETQTIPPPTNATGAAASFATVQPILQANCVGCHGDQSPKSGLSLTSYAGVMKGAASGPVIVAGDTAGSLLLKAIRGDAGAKKMPPGPKPVDPADIAKIEAWVKDGAKE